MNRFANRSDGARRRLPICSLSLPTLRRLVAPMVDDQPRMLGRGLSFFLRCTCVLIVIILKTEYVLHVEKWKVLNYSQVCPPQGLLFYAIAH